METFRGNVALVTGAGGGIGLATATAFAEAGASVVFADKDAVLLHAAADRLRAAGHDILAVTCDVTNRSQVKTMMEQALATYRRLDAALKNAGINCAGAPMHESLDPGLLSTAPAHQERVVAEEPTNARKSFGDIAPHLAEITDKVLFGDVWANPALSQRDRSLVTITSLIALYRTNELPFHLKRALDNGLTKDEIIATITHLAFYAGWPPAMTALQTARKVFDEAGA